ncbi:MAG: response regulator transcription factor [Eubacteriaceae bacterium]
MNTADASGKRKMTVNQNQTTHDLPYRCPGLLFSNVYQEPGTADAVCSELLSRNPEAGALLRAFLLYYRGETEESAQLAAKLLKDNCCFETRIGCCNILSLQALYHGDDETWRNARKTLALTACSTEQENAQVELYKGAMDSGLFIKSTYPDWFLEGCFDPIPVDDYPCLRYLYAKLLYMEFNYEKLAAVVIPFISQSRAEHALLSEIYLRIVAASGFQTVGDNEKAEKQLVKALELALPDHIYSPFAENHRHLGPLLENIMKNMDSDAWNTVAKLGDRIQTGWTHLYNELFGKKITNELTPREYDTARLALSGMSNGEIAERMGVSVNTVKFYLRNIYEKLHISSRKDLIPYMWEEV